MIVQIFNAPACGYARLVSVDTFDAFTFTQKLLRYGKSITKEGVVFSVDIGLVADAIADDTCVLEEVSTVDIVDKGVISIDIKAGTIDVAPVPVVPPPPDPAPDDPKVTKLIMVGFSREQAVALIDTLSK